MNTFFTSILIILLSIPLSIFNGWGLSKLWNWFIVPLFEVKQLSIPIAIGLTYITIYLTHVPDFNKKSEPKDIRIQSIASLAYIFMKVCIFLSFGWIVSRFI